VRLPEIENHENLLAAWKTQVRAARKTRLAKKVQNRQTFKLAFVARSVRFKSEVDRGAQSRKENVLKLAILKKVKVQPLQVNCSDIWNDLDASNKLKNDPSQNRNTRLETNCNIAKQHTKRPDKLNSRPDDCI